ncbi:uncharacterized protein BJ212DRAFT_1288859, partial [Suillus subaureus]
VWSLADETRLVDYIVDEHSKGGNGINFMKTFWTNAALHMAAGPVPEGAPKTCDSCQSKWALIQKMYKVVDKMNDALGLSYDMEKGANIDDGGETMWADYISVCNPDVRAFKNKGWPHFQKLQGVVPVTTSGWTGFYASLSNTKRIDPEP